MIVDPDFSPAWRILCNPPLQTFVVVHATSNVELLDYGIGTHVWNITKARCPEIWVEPSISTGFLMEGLILFIWSFVGICVALIILVFFLQTQDWFHEWLYGHEEFRVQELTDLFPSQRVRPLPPTPAQLSFKERQDKRPNARASMIGEQRRTSAEINVRLGNGRYSGASYPPPLTPDDEEMVVVRKANYTGRRHPRS
ncbi:MAG: hypothetical protein M1815_001752 [Lichina confinis]|nr:MAG: hypothetical protein M1815_001752 [Lichina confinis]